MPDCIPTPTVHQIGARPNLTNVPLFIGQFESNFRLQSNSPCINAGNNGYITNSSDLDGRLRVVGGVVDIGAYEFQGAGMSEFISWLQHNGLSTDGSADYADSDTDGHNNWQEWRADTVPTNSLSVLRLADVTNGGLGLEVTWESVATRNYFLQRATSLISLPPFTMLVTNIPGQLGTTTYTDTTAEGSGPFFYRVGVQP